MIAVIDFFKYLGSDATDSDQTWLDYYLPHIMTIHINYNHFIQITNVKMQKTSIVIEAK